jgi:UDP:flavonoid glycosyltransferase YjiC (YdhE family)
MSRRIAISTIGSHGDVQPFVALGVALRKRGHQVILGASSNFEGFVTGNGLEFHSLAPDMRQFIQQSDFDAAISKNVLYGAKLLRNGQRMMREAYRQLWTMSQGADALIFQWDTTFAIDIAEALDVPAIMGAFQPLNPTGEFPFFQFDNSNMQPLFNRIPIDPLVNRLSYLMQSAQQTYYDLPRDRLRAQLLGLRSSRRNSFTKNSRGEPITCLHAYSPTLSPRPGDWPESTIVTGFWRLPDNSNWEPDPALSEFLAAGDAPIYLGFGSMPWGAQRNTEIIAKALQMWGGRAVIGRGWGGIKAEQLPKGKVHVVDHVPHTKLFPLMKGLVHHGGAGTTHTGLYAGRPSFLVPQFFDQPYWGRRVHELGAGPRPVRLKKLTPGILAQALDALATDEGYALAASDIKDKLELEDGTGLAADIIEDVIAEYPGNYYRSAAVMEAAS